VPLPARRVSIYRILISHSYARSEEYQRLVRMLDRGAERDRRWRWKNCSVERDSPTISETESRLAEVYEEHMRRLLGQVHAILYILRDDWIADLGSLYIELVESSRLRYGTQVPIISVLPRGATLRSLDHGEVGVATVKWHAASIIRAVREFALPLFPGEMRLTRAQSAERTRIVDLLQGKARSLVKTAISLGMSEAALRKKILLYAIR